MRYSVAVLVGIGLIAASPQGFAEDNPFAKPAEKIETAACPAVDSKKFRNRLCLAISFYSYDDAPLPDYPYRYERVILEAACADPYNDEPEVIARKVREFWKREEANLYCNSIQFDVSNGSVLKYAALHLHDQVIHDASKWGIGLDWIDASDDRTLLDYVKYHAERSAGNSLEELEKNFRNYYEMLRKAGAKSASELK